MSATMRVPQERLSAYFNTFTKRFLYEGSMDAVDVEVLEHEWGDQHPVMGARLMGITYDADRNVLEFELDAGDHRIFEPREVWAVEEPDGFLSAVQVVRPDGAREVVRVQRVGLRRVGADGI